MRVMYTDQLGCDRLPSNETRMERHICLNLAFLNQLLILNRTQPVLVASPAAFWTSLPCRRDIIPKHQPYVQGLRLARAHMQNQSHQHIVRHRAAIFAFLIRKDVCRITEGENIPQPVFSVNCWDIGVWAVKPGERLHQHLGFTR